MKCSSKDIAAAPSSSVASLCTRVHLGTAARRLAQVRRRWATAADGGGGAVEALAEEAREASGARPSLSGATWQAGLLCGLRHHACTRAFSTAVAALASPMLQADVAVLDGRDAVYRARVELQAEAGLSGRGRRGCRSSVKV